MDNQLPILVFSLLEPGNIQRVALGEPVGTLIHGGKYECAGVRGSQERYRQHHRRHEKTLLKCVLVAHPPHSLKVRVLWRSLR
jgi:hypothetical protein